MQRAFQLLGVIALCTLMACGGNSRRLPWQFEETSDEDADAEVQDGPDLGSDATLDDPGTDDRDDGIRDARDARDARDVREVPKELADTAQPEDPGIDPTDLPPDSDATPGDLAIDAVSDDAVPSDNPREAGDADLADTEVPRVHCNEVADCYGVVAVGECESVSCISNGCVVGTKPDFSSCNDDSQCTDDDRCTEGVCIGKPIDCDDKNPCTHDTCSLESGCINEALPGPCDDGSLCTSSDECTGGYCIGTIVDCDDDDPCTEDGCDPGTGCTRAPLSRGQCDDGLTCTLGDHCLDGTCVGTAACDDNNPCTDDRCDSLAGCVREPASRPCDDGDPCTEADTCTQGTCLGIPNTCDDGNPCTDDACVPGVGCRSLPAAGPCDDQDSCTSGDSCRDGRCAGDAMICRTPPASECKEDAQTVIRYDPVGTCDEGNCAYPTTEHRCSEGCMDGACVGDPCEGVDCSTPPGPCFQAGTCVQGTCSYPPADGGACDDGNACTLGDHCASGQCMAGLAKPCDDGNSCTADRCDPLAGCLREPMSGPCEDGDPCTRGDSCLGMTCMSGQAISCDDGNSCTQDWCETGAGCRNQALADDTPCDDGNGCTGGDRCAEAVCSGTGLNCDDGNPCTDDRCDDPSVGCFSVPNTASCDDENPCTADDRCVDRACVPGAPANCDDADPCTVDACDPATGCVRTPTSGGSCDDGSPCTVGDTCQAGSCVGRPACDDGNPCTEDACDPGGTCTYAPRSGSCDDGNECTVEDACSAGTCLGSARTCDDGNPCTDDTCERGVGCTATPSDARPCDDSDACTQGDTCETGRCRGRPVTCTTPPAGSCDVEEGVVTAWAQPGTCTAGQCVYERLEYVCIHGCSGTQCIGNPCEGVDCSTAPNGCLVAPGECSGGSCVFAYANGRACNDGDPCTRDDSCLNGACVGGDPTPCDDANPCTADSCATGAGCVHLPVPGRCDDGNACTVADACQEGTCVPGTASTCDDANPCTQDICDTLTGCRNPALDDGFPCSDGNACTSEDQCTAGKCGGQGLSCDDGNPCTDDRCDNPTQGCYHLPNALACNDGNACTVDDTCSDGACVGGGAAGCDDGNYCTDDSCDPATGCSHADSTRQCGDATCAGLTFYAARFCAGGRCGPLVRLNCDDGVACTADSCSASGCSSEPRNTACPDDGDPCTSERCTPVLGCLSVFDTNPCDDGDPCTFLDTCTVGGGCAGSGYACNDHLDCTSDSCDGVGGCLFQVLPGTCRIDGACLAAGDPDPSNSCRTCDPSKDFYGWSPRDGVPCDDGLDCTTDDSCGAGACAGTTMACDDGNPCTDEQCVEGQGCAPTNNTSPCDDGNPCTVGESCGGGICHSGAPTSCEDGNPCTSSECLPAVGCTFAPLPGSCEDGDLCTVGDTCVSGRCAAGSSRPCDDGNPCTADDCTPAVGCTHAPGLEGSPCNDGNDCTTDDRCSGAGNCLGAGPDCDDHNPCTDDRCDTVETGCYHVDNTAPCDDGSLCTQTDRCEAGTCVGTNSLGCDDGNPCTTDRCDSAQGCLYEGNADPCDDGNACTTGDTCWLGLCTGGVDRVCDDNNACTADRCDPILGCVTSNIIQNCDDNNPCTTSDRCADGQCAGTPYVCDDTRECTVESCDGRGGCTSVLLPDHCIITGICRDRDETNPADPCRICNPSNSTTAWSDNAGGTCNDTRPCTLDDRCVAGLCLGTPYSCSDGLGCTSDSCDGLGGCTNQVAPSWCAIDGQCWQDGDPNPANPCEKCVFTLDSAWSPNDGGACSDGNPCTTLDTCLGRACVGGPARNCDDGNRCTDDECDAMGGCQSTNNDAVCEAAGCQGLLFQAERRCGDGMCPARSPVNCDDGNECTTDSCDALGCHHVANTGTCDDHNSCTYGDSCATGQCRGTAYVCEISECVSRNACDGQGGCIPTPRPEGSACASDSNACTNDICTAGTCQHPPKVEGSSCDDGSACTRVDVCRSGVCTGTLPVTCAAPDSCHEEGSCAPATGLCTIPTKVNGSPCDDSNLCTSQDQCVDGSCVGANPIVCAAADDCHLPGTCYPLTGECTRPAKYDGASCSDGNPCTLTDTCRSGTCTGGSPVTCPPQDACHLAGSCDQATGTCSNPLALDGTACDDGQKCTRNDSCLAGACSGEPVVCQAQDACHEAGTCDPVTGTCTGAVRGEGETCSDGRPCTKNDVCRGGVCTGNFYSCNDYLLCTADSCDGNGGCAHAPVAEWCVIDGLCRVAGTPQPGNACRWCAPAVDPLAWTAHDGATCDDFAPCTRDDTCSAGSCAGTTYSCDDQTPCTVDVCDGEGGCQNLLDSGVCLIDGECHANGTPKPGNPCMKCLASVAPRSWTALFEGDSCDDGNPCTFRDGCVSGTCTGVPYTCNDDLDCTADACLGTGLCSFTVQADSCAIRNRCFATGSPDPLDACRSCNPALTQTDFSPIANGTACEDGNPCTSDDACTDGRCRGVGTTCDDNLICTLDSCDSGNCTNPPIAGWCIIDGQCWSDRQLDPGNACRWCRPDLDAAAWSDRSGVLCDDGDACSRGDLCVGSTCTAGTLKDCNDNLSCTADACIGGACSNEVLAGFCVIENACRAEGAHPAATPCLTCVPSSDPRGWTAEAGTLCDDGAPCTFNDRCGGGVCEGTGYGCDDSRACTLDACDGLGGCSATMLADWCLIANTCHEADLANPDNPCEACRPAVSATTWSPLEGLACNDYNPCTTGDACQGGTCSGAPRDCQDTLPCTVDHCDATGLCRHLLDAGWCIIDGSCVPEGTLEPGRPCSACQPSADSRAWSPVSGLSCDDGEVCTTLDTCNNGTCAGSQYSCDDSLPCTLDQCTGAGGCAYAQAEGTCWIDGGCHLPDDLHPSNLCLHCDPTRTGTDWSPVSGQPCNDGQACTRDDTCDNGTCHGTAYGCGDTQPCTMDLCDGFGGCTNPLADGWCQIDGICRLGGAPHPTLSCMACVPDRDRYGWTQLTATADEVCNGADDNCDGVTDPPGSPGCVDYYLDNDQDGSGVSGSPHCLCYPAAPYSAPAPGDCNDDDSTVRPGGWEICDDKDNDCDGTANPEGSLGCVLYLYDFDDDGYGDGTASKCLCGPVDYYRALQGGDCDDTDPYVSGGADEICDGKDNNCDGLIDPPNAVGCRMYYADIDGDGYGFSGVCTCAPDSNFSILQGGDCNDSEPAVNPAATEVCNGRDDNCILGVDDGPVETLCATDPGVTSHGTVACFTGACIWTCDPRIEDPATPAWHDRDRSSANGCECLGDAYDHRGGATCQAAVDLGVLPDDGSRFEIEGNLSESGAEDWFMVTAMDTQWSQEVDSCDTFNLRVFLSSNPDGQFRIDVYRGGCLETDEICTSGDNAEWGVSFGTTAKGECPCSPAETTCTAPPSLEACLKKEGTMDKCGSCPGEAAPGTHRCVDNGRQFMVRVRKHPGAPESCEPYRLDFSNGAFPFSG